MKHTLLLTLLLAGVTLAQTNYVSLHGAHVPPFTNWATAATNMQAAVDLAQDGDFVLVSNGLYNSGSRVSPNAQLHSRVVITNAITLQSLNGPDVTAIVGAADPETGSSGSNAVRGVYMSGGAHLRGFTVSNGYVNTEGEQPADVFGDAVYIADIGIITESVAGFNPASNAGSIYGLGEICIVNSAILSNTGSGAFGCFAPALYLRNTLVAYNGSTHPWFPSGVLSESGSVHCSSVLHNAGSGIMVNHAIDLRNSIIWGNQQQIYGDDDFYTSAYNCIESWTRLDHGTISNDPQFVDAAAGDFRLLDTSPCINAGTNMPWMWTATDLDGNPRIQYDVVDMGCYESAVPEPGAIAIVALVAIWGRRNDHARRVGRTANSE